MAVLSFAQLEIPHVSDESGDDSIIDQVSQKGRKLRSLAEPEAWSYEPLMGARALHSIFAKLLWTRG